VTRHQQQNCDSPTTPTAAAAGVSPSPPVTPKTALRVVFSALKLPPPKSPISDSGNGQSNGQSNGVSNGFFNGFQPRRASADEYSSRGSSDGDSWRTGDSSSESGSTGNTGRKSLWLFAREHPLRVLAARTVRHPAFDKAVLVLICISSVSLAVDTPLRDPGTALMRGMRVLDAVLTVLFTVEMALKILPHGLLLSRKSYLRSSWNVLDATVVSVSLAGLILGGSKQSSLKSLRSLRALRALRPLRMINRAPGLKVVVSGSDY
jgi:Ion transport protein